MPLSVLGWTFNLVLAAYWFGRSLYKWRHGPARERSAYGALSGFNFCWLALSVVALYLLWRDGNA